MNQKQKQNQNKYGMKEVFTYEVYTKNGELLFEINTTKENDFSRLGFDGQFSIEDALVDILLVNTIMSGDLDSAPLRFKGKSVARGLDGVDREVMLQMEEVYLRDFSLIRVNGVYVSAMMFEISGAFTLSVIDEDVM